MSDFVAEDVLDVIEQQRVTNAVLVPTMIQMLLSVDGAADRDYSGLRSIAYGASPITTPVLKAALRTFDCSLYGIYGLTESTGGVIQLDPSDHDPAGPREYLLRSAGRPLPWVELRIVDPATGAVLWSAHRRASPIATPATVALGTAYEIAAHKAAEELVETWGEERPTS